MKLDFSHVVWVFAANDPERISPILRDRMTQIEVEELTPQDKVEILKRHVFPELRDQIGLKEGDVAEPSESAARHIIRFHSQLAGSAKEEGMRGIKRTTSHMLERLLLVRIAVKGATMESALSRLTDLGFPFAAVAPKLPGAIERWSTLGEPLTLDEETLNFLGHEPEPGTKRHTGHNMYI